MGWEIRDERVAEMDDCIVRMIVVCSFLVLVP